MCQTAVSWSHDPKYDTLRLSSHILAMPGNMRQLEQTGQQAAERFVHPEYFAA